MNRGAARAADEPVLPRRRLLQGAAGAVLAAGTVLSACGRLVPPLDGSTPVLLQLQPGGLVALDRSTVALYGELLQPFLDAQRGIRVRLLRTPWHGNVQALAAGRGPDVICDNYLPPYVNPGGDLLLALDGYLARDRVETAVWSAAQLTCYRSAAPNGALYALPGYFCPRVYAVRLADFDAVHLDRPAPGWTAAEFVSAVAALSAPGRYGAVLDWHTDHIGQATWPFRAFGSGIVNTSGQSDLGASANLQAGDYLYQQLLWPGHATSVDLLGPAAAPGAFAADGTAMQICWNGYVLGQAPGWHGFAWDFYPPPGYPHGPTCGADHYFYAIPAASAHPEAAWSLLHYLAADTSASGWQAGLIGMAVQQPAVLPLWDRWAATVAAAAPALAGKQLTVFGALAAAGAWPQQYYPRLDLECQNLAVPQLRALWARDTTVQVAFPAIDRMVNALLSSAASASSVGAAGEALPAGG